MDKKRFLYLVMASTLLTTNTVWAQAATETEQVEVDEMTEMTETSSDTVLTVSELSELILEHYNTDEIQYSANTETFSDGESVSFYYVNDDQSVVGLPIYIRLDKDDPEVIDNIYVQLDNETMEQSLNDLADLFQWQDATVEPEHADTLTFEEWKKEVTSSDGFYTNIVTIGNMELDCSISMVMGTIYISYVETGL